MPPRRCWASATAASTEAWSVTSQATMPSPAATSRPTTRAPRARSAVAVAEPMPPAAPVMTTRGALLVSVITYGSVTYSGVG